MKKLLVANRGEIACRIMKTAKELGIETVAVYSDIDKEALHVLEADEAFHLGESTPSQSYLNIEKIIEAAKQTGADAIHPGYGFLSENADFAEAVANAHLTFVGPSASAMRKLGDKTTARALAIEAGAPVAPGFNDPTASLDEMKEAAQEIGYPVLIKAAAGGGGKGMRVVRDEKDFLTEAALASAEAKAAFADGRIFLEKYLEWPRHVEFQVIADNAGGALHLFERECSIQRRHQKIIEESPSPIMTDTLRAQMAEAALRIVKAAGYVNAGTVEFLVDQSGGFYFLEVNTRLQVEHPVTEMITGLDIVRMQLDIADGKPLSLTQEAIAKSGHAIECRIYAEDAANRFMPSAGRIAFMQAPTGAGVRFDTGVYSGATVPVHYDPILSKLIVHAPTRAAAIERMKRALADAVVLGVHTSTGFMLDVLGSDAFTNGETHTHLLDESFTDWKPDERAFPFVQLGQALAEEMLPQSVGYTGGDSAGQSACPSVWKRLGRWDIV